MLRNAQQIYGKKLGASDGGIGQVKDFYVDDRTWTIRYLIADASSWLADRQVLILPKVVRSLDPEHASIPIDLTRKQIEDSPPISLHLPVSRQYEEQYHRYYGMPYYWEGNGLWNMTGIQLQNLDPQPVPPGAGTAAQNRGDPHLRSMRMMKGYSIHARDGNIGTLSDFSFDDESWDIVHLTIETGHWYAGKQIYLLPEQVERISYGDAAIFVNLSMEDIRSTAAHATAVMNSVTG